MFARSGLAFCTGAIFLALGAGNAFAEQWQQYWSEGSYTHYVDVDSARMEASYLVFESLAELLKPELDVKNGDSGPWQSVVTTKVVDCTARRFWEWKSTRYGGPRGTGAVVNQREDKNHPPTAPAFNPSLKTMVAYACDSLLKVAHGRTPARAAQERKQSRPGTEEQDAARLDGKDNEGLTKLGSELLDTLNKLPDARRASRAEWETFQARKLKEQQEQARRRAEAQRALQTDGSNSQYRDDCEAFRMGRGPYVQGCTAKNPGQQ